MTYSTFGPQGCTVPAINPFGDLDFADWPTVHVLITDPNSHTRRRLARVVHDHSSPRPGPFVAWSCAIAKARGDARLGMRLTLESARDGSVFLDGIEEMSADVQAELFEFLTAESFGKFWTGASRRERTVRLIAGASTSLLPGSRDGAFDEALFYRLNMVHIMIDNYC